MSNPPALISRKLLFGNPERAAVTVSPDGTKLAFLAPVDGVLNVWVAPVAEPEKAEPVTQDRGRGIRAYEWAYTNAHILYTQDRDGDENWHLYATDLRARETRDLTPHPATQARVQHVSRRFPEEILVGLNNRDARFHDVHRLNILTGETRLMQQNSEFMGFLTDEDLAIRFAFRQTPDGGWEMLRRTGEEQWDLFIRADLEDTEGTGPITLDASGRRLYLTDSRGRDTAALFCWDLGSGERRLLAEDARNDPGGFLLHPASKAVQAVSFNYERLSWKVLDSEIAPDFQALGAVSDGDIHVVRRSLDDSTWIVLYTLERRSRAVLPLRPQVAPGRVPLHRPARARRAAARENAPRRHPRARRPRPGQLSHAASGRRRPAEKTAADGPLRSWRAVGAR